MIRALYTPDIFSLQRVGGISRYFCELISRIPSLGVGARAVAGIHFNRHLRMLPGKTGLYIPKLGPLGTRRLAFNQMLCRRVAARNPNAIIHFTYYSRSEFPTSHPRVLTVYDLIEERFPHSATARLSDVKRRHCERADHLIAISASTKNDLIEIFKIPTEKITVIHLGDSLPKISSKVPSTKFERYLLFVGVRREYKNFVRFLEAFAASPFLRSNFNIVAFGGGPFSEEEENEFLRLKLDNKVQQIEGDDRVLAPLYRGAAALVFPSLYEGFGLPVIEAMGQDCPIICSRGGSLPEIGGDAVAYFDGLDVASMQSVMEETLGNADRLAELRQLGAVRRNLFSWDKCAQETADVYRKLERLTSG